MKQIRPTRKKARSLGAKVEWILRFSHKMPVLCSILKLLFNATVYHIWGWRETIGVLVIRFDLSGASAAMSSTLSKIASANLKQVLMRVNSLVASYLDGMWIYLIGVEAAKRANGWVP